MLRHLCFLAANGVVCAAAVMWMIVPTFLFFAERDNRIGEQRLLLARLTSMASQRTKVQTLAQQMAARREEFLIGSNEGVINAELQTKLKQMTEAASARVRSVQGLPAISDERVRYSGSRIEIFGSIQAIHRTIYAIENVKPYLFVTSALIRGAPPSSGHVGGSREPVLQAQLDVYGAIEVKGRDL